MAHGRLAGHGEGRWADSGWDGLWLACDTRYGASAEEVCKRDRGYWKEVTMSEKMWVAANGQEITEEMIDGWCDAYEPEDFLGVIRKDSPQLICD